MEPIDIFFKYSAPILIWALPLIGALLTPLFGRINNKLRDYMAVVFSFSAVVSAVFMIPWLLAGNYPGDVKVLTWMKFPTGGALEIGVLVDPLSIIIANVVAFISFLIIVYSLGYMEGDPGLTRYWFLMQFFIGSMLLLVLSDNMIQMLIGWEGVGLCSYALIGYYYRDEKEHWLGGPPPTPMYPPSHAGMKAFVVTGFGDILLLGAIFIMYNYAHTFNFVELIQQSGTWLSQMAKVPGLLSLTAILLLGGPIGKSAQFPLHEWLPEAMAGPTTVSALIHAATMVKAGVYLVARVSPIFFIGRWALAQPILEAQTFFIAIAGIGAFTAILAASQAMVGLELKKILAYSTVSQIGYMMLGLGISGLTVQGFVTGMTSGIYHLVSHALFKAALFLCAGAVIHTVESIYVTDMGGLKKWMPITHGFMLLAALSLSGIPPFSGFWSKDAVFVATLAAAENPWSLVFLALAAVSAAMTFFYSLRMISLTFYGQPSEHIKEMEHEGHHVHEAKPVMWLPFAILVTVMVVLGLLGLVGLFMPNLSPEVFIEKQFEGMIKQEFSMQPPVAEVATGTRFIAAEISGIVLAIGGIAGWFIYLARRTNPKDLVEKSSMLRGIHKFLWNRWYINRLYYKVFVDGTLKLKQAIFQQFELKVIDRIDDAASRAFMMFGSELFKVIEIGGIDGYFNRGVPALFSAIYNRVKKIQTGLLSYNVLYIMLVFTALLVAILVWSR